MKNKGIYLSLLSATLLSQAVSAATVDTQTKPVSEQIIVKFKSTPSMVAMSSQLASITKLPIKTSKPMAGGAYVIYFDGAKLAKTMLSKQQQLERALAKLRANPNVVYAVKDRIGYFKPISDPKVTLANLSHDVQWDEFQAPAGVMLESKPGARDGAWQYSMGQTQSKPVVVAVLDTGIEENPSLVDNIVKDENGDVFGWNFAANDKNLSDETGGYHGTHVAGTIAGYGNTMMGMGPNLKILPAKIPDSSGMFYESAVINALYWSVGGDIPGVPKNPYPAKVLNMSFGVDERPGKEIDHCDEALQDALWFVRKQGAVAIVAAGNDNRWEHYNAPAVCNGTLKIASTGPEGLRAYYSNYGPGVSFAAPGGDKRYGSEGGILSTVKPGTGYGGSGFDFYQGTSMASPHVAGLAGLIYAMGENDSTLTPERVEQIMYTTTHDFGQSSDSNYSCVDDKPCGHGIIDANNAMKAMVKGFKVYFSAPKLPTSLSSCQSLQANDIATDEGRWEMIVNSCQVMTSSHSPRVREDKGQIIADYGSVAYRLKPNYSHCEVIGFDGIGCY
jgi:serine protease